MTSSEISSHSRASHLPRPARGGTKILHNWEPKTQGPHERPAACTEKTKQAGELGWDWGGEDRQRTAPHHTGEPSNLTCSMGRRGQTQLARMPGESLSWLEAFLCPLQPHPAESKAGAPTPLPSWGEQRTQNGGNHLFPHPWGPQGTRTTVDTTGDSLAVHHSVQAHGNPPSPT